MPVARSPEAVQVDAELASSGLGFPPPRGAEIPYGPPENGRSGPREVLLEQPATHISVTHTAREPGDLLDGGALRTERSARFGRDETRTELQVEPEHSQLSVELVEFLLVDRLGRRPPLGPDPDPQ